MDKIEYFPRKKMFEEVQELVASFYSTGDYLSEEYQEYSSMLDSDGKVDEFYYSLLLLSLLSYTGELISTIEKIIRNINSYRFKRKEISEDLFVGEIDIDEYINKNYIEKSFPKVYPSIISYSSYQLPEFQLTLCIVEHCASIYHHIFDVLGNHEGVTTFDNSYRYYKQLEWYFTKLRKKYGITYSHNETYFDLKRKVIYRYRNRKIQSPVYIDLIKLYEKIMSLKAFNASSSELLDIVDHTERFDDRLFEIWLIRKTSEYLAVKMGLNISDIKYVPLFIARRTNTAAVKLSNQQCRIEIFYQNRKHYMPKNQLKWYWEKDGHKEEIGAIPDLVFMKCPAVGTNAEDIVLLDAKNREWEFSHDTERIVDEVVQQIYIHDNFVSLFQDKYSSMLIAHNNNVLQDRKYYHKDLQNCEIDVISMVFSENSLNDSIRKIGDDLSEYLEM